MDQDDARWRITGVLRIVVAIIAAIGLIEVVGGFLGGRGSGPVAYGAAPDSQPAAGSGHKEFTERQYRAALLQFNKQTLGNWYERKGRKGAKWDAKARAFLDAMAVRFTNAGASPAVWTVGKTDAELRTMGKAAMDAGCDDPLVEYSMSVLFLDQGASAEAKTWTYKCVDGIQQSPGGNYPPVRLTFAAHRAYAFLPSHDAEREKYWGIFADSALNACRAAKGIERRIICSMLWNTLSSDPHPRVEQWCRRLDGDGQVDPWLKDVFTGLVEINAAWDARGTGFANTVAQQGWEGFYAHLEEAQKRLKSAWQREPTYPESATAMISVAMGGGDRLNEDPRAWLDKALSAQIDYLQAIEAYFYSQLPRWGGDYRKMYEFGGELLASNRYDTGLPWQYITALKKISRDSGSRAIWQGPRVYETIEAICKSYEPHYPTAELRNWLKSCQVAFAWRANRFIEARKIFDQLGKNFDPKAFDEPDEQWPVALSEVIARSGTSAPAVEEAEKLAHSGKIDEAIEQYKKLVMASKGGQDDKGVPFLVGRVAMLRWFKDYAAGKWADIQPGGDLGGWFRTSGEWEVQGDGSLVATLKPERNAMVLMCLAEFFGPRYELEGTVEISGGGQSGEGGETPRGGFLWSAGGSTYFYGAYLEQGAGGGAASGNLLVDSNPPERTPIAELKPVNTLHVRVADSQVTVSVNGNVIAPQAAGASAFNSYPRHFLQVGATKVPPGTVLKFRDLKIRRLPQPGAPGDGADKGKL